VRRFQRSVDFQEPLRHQGEGSRDRVGTGDHDLVGPELAAGDALQRDLSLLSRNVQQGKRIDRRGFGRRFPGSRTRQRERQGNERQAQAQQEHERQRGGTDEYPEHGG